MATISSFPVCVTGSRHGAGEHQLDVFRRHLSLLYARGCRELRHGACVGLDTQAAILGREFLMEVVAHPGDLPQWTSQAALEASTQVLPARSNKARNQALADHAVSAGGVMLAAPSGREDAPEGRRSGTWQAIRMGRFRCPLAVVMPDGCVGYVGWDKLPG